MLALSLHRAFCLWVRLAIVFPVVPGDRSCWKQAFSDVMVSVGIVGAC